MVKEIYTLLIWASIKKKLGYKSHWLVVTNEYINRNEL